MTDERGTPPKALSPAERAEAELWARASPHEQAAALMIGKATGQERVPHILAELMTVKPKDAIEARLAALSFALTHAAFENLASARVLQPYPDSMADRARLAAVRLAEAGMKAVDALGRHRAGGATAHRVVVEHTGPAAELAIGLRVTPAGGRGQEDGRRGHGPATGAIEAGTDLRCEDAGGGAVPVPRASGPEAVPDARREGRRA